MSSARCLLSAVIKQRSRPVYLFMRGTSNSGKTSGSGLSEERETSANQIDRTDKVKYRDKKNNLLKPKPSDLATLKILETIDAAVKDIHGDDTVSQKKSKSELIAKLAECEKEKFHAATCAQFSEMVSDKAISKFLTSLRSPAEKPPPRAIEMRRVRQGLLLLKREVFDQAIHTGYNAKNARLIAERAVKLAEDKAIEKYANLSKGYDEKESKEKKAKVEQDEKEYAFYNVAVQLASKILYPDESPSGVSVKAVANVVNPSSNLENIFSKRDDRLNVFKAESISRLNEHCLGRWADWDKNSAEIWNRSFGPTNAFEEMIELTEEGKMWPYPINNEYQIGEEDEVGFHEHIFLDKYLAKYGLPTEGPVAHFMELVCVGLSKNPYMTVKKKRAHIDWFANYFVQKTEEIRRIQEESLSDDGVVTPGSAI